MPWPAITVGIVERMHEGRAALGLQTRRHRLGVTVGIAGQHHLDHRAAEAAHRVDLHLRRGHRHHDGGADAQPGRGQRHALGMVAGRCGDHAARALPASSCTMRL